MCALITFRHCVSNGAWSLEKDDVNLIASYIKIRIWFSSLPLKGDHVVFSAEVIKTMKYHPPPYSLKSMYFLTSASKLHEKLQDLVKQYISSQMPESVLDGVYWCFGNCDFGLLAEKRNFRVSNS